MKSPSIETGIFIADIHHRSHGGRMRYAPTPVRLIHGYNDLGTNIPINGLTPSRMCRDAPTLNWRIEKRRSTRGQNSAFSMMIPIALSEDRMTYSSVILLILSIISTGRSFFQKRRHEMSRSVISPSLSTKKKVPAGSILHCELPEGPVTTFTPSA